MAEGGNITLDKITKARDDYYKERLKYLDYDTTAVMDKYYDVPSEDNNTRELVFIIWGILSVGYMSYELFNMIKNKLQYNCKMAEGGFDENAPLLNEDKNAQDDDYRENIEMYELSSQMPVGNEGELQQNYVLNVLFYIHRSFRKILHPMLSGFISSMLLACFCNAALAAFEIVT